MHSATFNVMRIGITLICLIGVPIVALVGIGGKSTSAQATIRPAERHAVRSVASANQRQMNVATSRQTSSTAAVEVAQAQPIRSHLDKSPLPASSRITAEEVRFSSRNGDLPVRTVSASSDSISNQLQRLQTLGATYYRLEWVSKQPGEYWFFCRVPASERPLEAFGRTPLAAVERVVDAVEGLRARSDEPTKVEDRSAAATQRTASQRSSSVYRR